MDVYSSIAQKLAVLSEPVASREYAFRDGGGGDKWSYGLSSSGHLKSIDHHRTRRNARNALQDTPLARAMVERMADTVADVGMRLEMAPVFSVLGLTAAEADEWARDVSQRFHLWASCKKQHRSEQLTFYQYQRLYSLGQQRDNDLFTRLFYNRDRGLQNPLQFSELDPDQVRGDAITTTGGFPCNIGDGIERDDRGREVAYKVWLQNEKGGYDYVTVPAKGRSGRIHMLHGFRPEYAGQVRGYSRLSHAIQEFENLTDFSSSSIKKAINQSNIVGFVEPSKDEDAVNPFEGILTQNGAGPAAQLFGSDPQQVPGIPVVPDTDGQSVQDFYRVPEATMDTPGSMFIANLTKGSTVKFAENSAPADDYDKFVDAFASYLSASTGNPLEVVLMKFGQNYSASRATLILFWRIVNGWRAEMDADLLSPTVEMWLAGEIAAGRVVAPGWSDPRLRAAWLQKNWIATSAPDIDPVKTAKARRENIEMGLTNQERESRDLNGSSAAANIEKNRALFADYPLAPWVQQPRNEAMNILEEIQNTLEDGVS